MSRYEEKNQLDYRMGGDTIDDFAQKHMAEITRIFQFLNDLREHKITGSEYTAPAPGMLRVDDEKIYIRNSANDDWVLLGEVATNLGFTAETVGAVATTKGGLNTFLAGKDTEKATTAADYDMYFALDTSTVYIYYNDKWNTYLSLNPKNLLNIDDYLEWSDVDDGTGDKVSKIVQSNAKGKLDYDITGNAAQVANKAVSVKDIADGDGLVYDEASDALVNKSLVTKDKLNRADISITGNAAKIADTTVKVIDGTLNDGDVLTYSAANEQWRNDYKVSTSGGKAGVIAATNSTGVLNFDIAGNAGKVAGIEMGINNLKDGQVLTYRSASNTWRNEDKGVVGAGKALALYAGDELLVEYSGDAPQTLDLETIKVDNAISADTLATARTLTITDGTNSGTATSFDGSANVSIKLPSTIKASLSGNATTASTLATGRTIALEGGATGTATAFDGSADISIPVTALDASKISNVATIFNTMFGNYGNPAAAHNAFYRGKDLTDYWESGEMSKAIQAGTFDDIYPGDYITKAVTINSTAYTVKWIVGDLDYHLGMGDVETTAHHALMFAESRIFAATMNSTNVTTGAYVGSNMWTTTIPLVATGIQNAFGSEHVLSHRELLSSASNDTITSGAGAGWVGSSTNWMWCYTLANIFNEPMVYGTKVLSSSFYDIGECNSQIAAFRHNHGLIAIGRTWSWLRAVASSTRFAYINGFGTADGNFAGYADENGTVRPYFLLR